MLIALELIEFALLHAIMRLGRASMHNTDEIMRNLFNYNAINANIEALHARTHVNVNDHKTDYRF